MPQHVYMSLEKLQHRQVCAAKYRLARAVNPILPCSSSLKSQIAEVYDQGSENSCTANAYCNAYRVLNKDKTFIPSRQYVYYKERQTENVTTDTGSDIKDGINFVTQNGVCSDASWPYDSATVNTAPPDNCNVESAQHKLGTLTAIDVGDLYTMRTCLFNGSPVLIAIAVYESFESKWTKATGIISNPNTTTETALGGHEVLLTGYNDILGYFTFVNSWGTIWGNKGFGYLPYSYVTNKNLTWSLYYIG